MAGERPRVLLLIPSYARTGIEAAVRADQHPTMDYHALQKELDADLADYAAVDSAPEPLVRFLRRFSRDAGLAALGFARRRRYDVIYSNGENVSIPLAALFRLSRRRPGHVLIGHHLSTPKKQAPLRMLHRAMDDILVYAETQRAHAVDRLGIPASRVHLIPFHADHRFYRPLDVTPRRMICSAGLEWRDYPTLIEAVRDLDVEVRLAAASPWSKHRDETRDRRLPANVSARRYEYGELRQLYAESLFVVVPLYDNDFQAGVTTILEAMAMGKAVVVTRTVGQKDVVSHGVDGLYVPPGDVDALREAIVSLLECPERCLRMGERARQTVEAGMTLDHWVGRVSAVVRHAAACRDGSMAASSSM